MADNKKKVLVIPNIHSAGIELLAARPDIDYQILESQAPEAILNNVADAHAIAVRTALISREVINAAPHLQVVARHGVG